MIVQSLIARFPGISMASVTDGPEEAETEADLSGTKNLSSIALDLTVSLAAQSYEKPKHSFDLVIALNTPSNAMECISELLVERRQAVLGRNASTISYDLKKAGFWVLEFSMKDTMFVTSRIMEAISPHQRLFS